MELSGKNVFVTGGAGFIGSALVRDLLKEGSNVVIYDNYLSGDLSNIEEIKNEVTLIEGLKRTIAWYKENESLWPWERKIASEGEIWHRGL